MDTARHVWLSCLPLSHIGGLSVVTRALLTGTRLVVLPRFDAETVEGVGRSGRATHVSVVATALRRLDPGVFTTVLLGGAAPPEGLGANVVTTYGLTETGSGLVYDGVVLDGVSVAIGTGRPGQGASGEVLVRGPMLLRAYRDGTDPKVPGPDGAGGWLPTGDGGRLDDQGVLSVDGRLAEVIVTGGEKVWPAAVEGVVAVSPGWPRWRSAGRPRVGRTGGGLGPARGLGGSPSLAALQDAVRSRLAPWAAPKELVLVDGLPWTASGKVRRADLS